MTDQPKLLVVDDEAAICEGCNRIFSKQAEPARLIAQPDDLDVHCRSHTVMSHGLVCVSSPNGEKSARKTPAGAPPTP